jgi:hypothetical protein
MCPILSSRPPPFLQRMPREMRPRRGHSVYLASDSERWHFACSGTLHPIYRSWKRIVEHTNRPRFIYIIANRASRTEPQVVK